MGFLNAAHAGGNRAGYNWMGRPESKNIEDNSQVIYNGMNYDQMKAKIKEMQNQLLQLQSPEMISTVSRCNNDSPASQLYKARIGTFHLGNFDNAVDALYGKNKTIKIRKTPVGLSCEDLLSAKVAKQAQMRALHDMRDTFAQLESLTNTVMRRDCKTPSGLVTDKFLFHFAALSLSMYQAVDGKQFEDVFGMNALIDAFKYNCTTSPVDDAPPPTEAPQ